MININSGLFSAGFKIQKYIPIFKNQSLSLLRKLIFWYLDGTFASDTLCEPSSG